MKAVFLTTASLFLTFSIYGDSVTSVVTMSEAEFWEIVETAKVRAASQTERPAALETLLEGLPANKIVEFEKHFQIAVDQAYDNKLWAAAYLLNGGCSNDCFIDFRRWLISNGRSIYTKALKDPDIVGSFYKSADGATLEDYGYAAFNVHERKTGKFMDLDDWNYKWRYEPTGETWEEEDLPKLLPKTHKAISGFWSFPKLWE